MIVPGTKGLFPPVVPFRVTTELLGSPQEPKPPFFGFSSTYTVTPLILQEPSSSLSFVTHTLPVMVPCEQEASAESERLQAFPGEGLGLALGLGEGDGLGDGDGLGEGLTDGLGEGVTEGEGLGLALGEGDGLGDTEGLGDGDGEPLGLGDGGADPLGDGLGRGDTASTEGSLTPLTLGLT
ncbi:hypothetical protein Tter_2818 [Thermobaculum terrenum ATCC BAA-798]|uniref:Uncharacterized protein n=1 Tax=Thermobaculum terrenum (strain ATCC BAA-798 / CCMEE 7001 / YNP1) TaxID=525904 RepID=D1CIY2_THET1|nr:hypothetical protein Tter_2818 [Thermobaculum terrenum ATCC BAA-798]